MSYESNLFILSEAIKVCASQDKHTLKHGLEIVKHALTQLQPHFTDEKFMILFLKH